MLGIIFYCFGVMYTPGPVNILSLSRGMQSEVRAHIAFCLGVGAALCVWFLAIGYAGSVFASQAAMPLISALGVLFILYLAYKIITAKIDTASRDTKTTALTFKDGLLLQLLNPKSFVAVFPVTAVQFPAAGIEGVEIAIWAIGLSALGFGAPFAYAALGARVSSFVENPRSLKRLNVLMGIMLLAVGVEIAYQHIYLAL